MKFSNLFFGSIRKLIFFKDFFKYISSDKSDVFEVKLNKIKTSFSTTRMQIIRHVINLWAEVVGITITLGAGEPRDVGLRHRR